MIVDLADRHGRPIRTALRLDIAPEDAILRQARLGTHMAGPGWENWKKAFRDSFDNIERVVRGEKPLWVIPALGG